jgi:tetratricopeptide (TPR) repeat protein
LNWLQRTFSQSTSSRLFQSSLSQAHKGLHTTAHQTVDSLIHRAHKRANSGDVLGALADFDEAIQGNPGRATPYFNRGLLHNILGNFEAAITDFNQTLEYLPDYDEVYYQRGVSYFHLKNLDQALNDFDQAIQLNSFSIKSYYKRAEIYAEHGDVPSVLENYAQVLSKIPNDANAYHHRGVFLAKIGELHSAIVDFSSAIANNPNHSEAYCSRGCCYAQSGQLDHAKQDFQQALLYNPSSQAAYYQQIYGLQSLNGADTTLIEPTAPPTQQYFERANQRASEGDSKGAIADYTRVLELDPENTQAYYHRSQQLQTLGHQAEAMADLEEAIHWARVHSLGLLRDFSGALSDTLTTLKTDPSQSDLHTALISQKCSIEATIEDCSQRIEANPGDANAYFRRAQSRALKGDLQGAIADYTETLRLNPHHAEAHYRRALSHSALGNKAAATYDFQRAILYTPVEIDAQSESQIEYSRTHLTALTTVSPLLLSAQSLNHATLGQYLVSQCNHQDNAPDNRFCVHCGQPLWSALPKD